VHDVKKQEQPKERSKSNEEKQVVKPELTVIYCPPFLMRVGTISVLRQKYPTL
jgi:hypothetical protein